MHCACVHTNSNLMRGFVANDPPPPTVFVWVRFEAEFTRIQISGYQRSGYHRSVYTCWIETYSAFTRVQASRCILRGILTVWRRNAQVLSFGQVACLQTLFHFFFLFVDLCWLGDMVYFLFGKFSYWLWNTALDGKVRLGIGPANACETAFLNSWSNVENFEIRLCCHRTRKEWKKKFLKLAERKKTGFKSNETAEGMHIRHGNTSPYPEAPFINVRRAPGHQDDPLLKSFSNSFG